MCKHSFCLLTRTNVLCILYTNTHSYYEVINLKYIKLVKRSFDFSIIILFAAGGLFFWTTATASEADYLEKYHTEEWTVSEGESLWSIASKHQKGLDLSIQQTIHWMKENNEINNESIFPGQMLYLPKQIETVASK